MTTTAKTAQVLADLIAQAREYDRRGDVTLRDQTVRSIRDAAPSRASAARCVASVFGPAK